MPWRMYGTADGHTVMADGSIAVGPGARLTMSRWRAAIGALAKAGANIILDEVFLEGGQDQVRWRESLDGLAVTWVQVRCDVEVASAREAARGDRAANLAEFQARVVHAGVEYDIVVDTTNLLPEDAAVVVIAQLRD